jgi:hypothetical protein
MRNVDFEYNALRRVAGFVMYCMTIIATNVQSISYSEILFVNIATVACDINKLC